jgi:alpha-D-ribose 1-methylphosphonate 5-triphosphate synthase subunit PhnH
MAGDSVFLGGFTDPVDDSQRVFRGVLDALSCPGRVVEVAVQTAPPAPLTRGLAAVALALLDADTTVWLDGALAESTQVAAWLRFHTGAVVVRDPSAADFALILSSVSCPRLETFSAGTTENPHLSATLVVNTDGVPERAEALLTGPGIQDFHRAVIPACWPDLIAQWDRNTRMFPRGVDVVFVGGSGACLQVSALPRTTSLTTVTGGN